MSSVGAGWPLDLGAGGAAAAVVFGVGAFLAAFEGGARPIDPFETSRGFLGRAADEGTEEVDLCLLFAAPKGGGGGGGGALGLLPSLSLTEGLAALAAASTR